MWSDFSWLNDMVLKRCHADALRAEYCAAEDSGPCWSERVCYGFTEFSIETNNVLQVELKSSFLP